MISSPSTKNKQTNKNYHKKPTTKQAVFLNFLTTQWLSLSICIHACSTFEAALRWGWTRLMTSNDPFLNYSMITCKAYPNTTQYNVLLQSNTL